MRHGPFNCSPYQNVGGPRFDLEKQKSLLFFLIYFRCKETEPEVRRDGQCCCIQCLRQGSESRPGCCICARVRGQRAPTLCLCREGELKVTKD